MRKSANSIYAVTGNPILHSKSPDMFNAAFRDLALDAAYVRLAAQSAEEAMAVARKIGIHGLNVTSPFKTEIIPCLDELEKGAEKMGSVNAVLQKDGKYIGYNTDADGVLQGAQRRRFRSPGEKGRVLGAGGAAMSAVFALCSRAPML